jgi:hypothetical protein
MFDGLARQNMLFHQCIGELVDNAIAAARPPKFAIEVVLESDSQYPDKVVVTIADQGKGMNLETLSKALQVGESATTENRLNEHGFGMKNALATMSGGSGAWDLWSCAEEGDVLHVCGPFRKNMEIEDVDSFPPDVPGVDVSTVVRTRVKLAFLQTVQGRGAPGKGLESLGDWLVEHLGVMYRGFLMQDPVTTDDAGSIYVTMGAGSNRVRVPPVQVPMATSETKYIDVSLGGHQEHLEYRFGTLDDVKRKTAVRNKPVRYYYQGNQQTQGIDIRLGKRVIATRQMESIWNDGTTCIARHNSYNDFVGELIIPDLPRGVLTTTSNKTDFDLTDPGWKTIFDELNSSRPPKNQREHSEEDLKRKWMERIKASDPDDLVSDEKHVWPPGARIDVFRKKHGSNKVIIYELKVGSAQPGHLYQLKMYWDGLLMQNEEDFPDEAILLVEDFTTSLEEMATQMNDMKPPKGEKPYRFRIQKLTDVGLLSSTEKH